MMKIIIISISSSTTTLQVPIIIHEQEPIDTTIKLLLHIMTLYYKVVGGSLRTKGLGSLRTTGSLRTKKHHLEPHK